MLFESLSQPKIFILLFLYGLCSGLIFDFCEFIVFLCNKNKIIKIIFEFFATSISIFIFFIVILKLDYGDLRFYHICSFWGALIIQRITIGKLFEKVFDWCYNSFVKYVNLLIKKLNKRNSIKS